MPRTDFTQTAALTIGASSGTEQYGLASNRVAGGGGGASTLDDLTDVTISSATIYDHLEYNGSAWVNTQNLTLAGSADLIWNGASCSILVSGGVLDIDTSVFGGNLKVSGSICASWTATALTMNSGNELRLRASTQRVYSSGANALDLDGPTVNFRESGTIRMVLDGAALTMQSTNPIAFNASTEKISGDGAGTLIFDAATSHAWKFGGVSNTSLTNTTLTGPPSWTVKSTNAIAFDSGLGSMTFLVNATLEGTLTSAGLKLETDNYVSFQSGTTEKIWSSAASTLDLTANTTMVFRIAAAAEMTLTADYLTTNNGTQDAHLSWYTNKQIDVGFSSTFISSTQGISPGRQSWFAFTTNESGDYELSKLVFRGWYDTGSEADPNGLLGVAAYIEARYAALASNYFLRAYVSTTSAWVATTTDIGFINNGLNYHATNGLRFSPDSVTSNFRIYEKAANDWTLDTSGSGNPTISIRPRGNAELILDSPSTASFTSTTSGGCTTFNLRMSSGSAHTFNISTSGAGALTLNLGNATATVNLVSSSEWSFNSTTLTVGSGNYIILAAATTSIPSIRMPAGTAPSSKTEGDLWLDSTQECLVKYTHGNTTAGISNYDVGNLYTQVTSKTVNTSTSETTLIDTTSAVGTVTLPATFFVTGKSMRVYAAGVLGTKSLTSPTIRIKVKKGSTVLADTTAQTASTLGITGREWVLGVLITARSTTSVMSQGFFSFMDQTVSVGALRVMECNNGSTAVTIGTTSEAIDVTVQWGTSDAANTITCTNLTLEVLS